MNGRSYDLRYVASVRYSLCISQNKRPRCPLRLQISAASALKGRRPYWGSQRNWIGDYLSLSAENAESERYNAAVRNLQREDRFSKVKLIIRVC